MERLEFITKLSDGSFGSREKWLAFDRKISRKVVLEKLKKAFDSSSQDACNIKKEDFREALLQRCSRRHPGIHLCNGLVKDEFMNVYISLECHQGISLERWLDASQRDGNLLSTELVRRVFLQLANAVEHLHFLQIVHCAINPANVLLHFETEDIAQSQQALKISSINSINTEKVRVKLANFKEASTAGDPARFLKKDEMNLTDRFSDILPPFVHKFTPRNRGVSCFHSSNSESKYFTSRPTYGTMDATNLGRPWFECSRKSSGCRHNSIFLENTIQPSFDIWCFGAMLFLCVTGYRHWCARCGCFTERNSLSASIRRVRHRSFSFSTRKRLPKIKVQPGAWSDLSPDLQKMLASMVSPLPSDRPSIHEVIQYSLFLPETKWKKH